VLSVLTADNKDQAIGNRFWYQKLGDFFRITDHAAAITGLYDIVHADNSLSFQQKIWELAKLADDGEQFRAALKLKVGHDHGDSLVTVSLSDSHIATMKFENSLVLMDSLFEPTLKNFGEYQLKGNFKDFQRFTDFKALHEAANDPQAFLEKVDQDIREAGESVAYDEISFDDIGFCNQIKRDLHRTKEFFPETNQVTNELDGTTKVDSTIMTQERYRIMVITNFEPRLIARLKDDIKGSYENFCNLPIAQQMLVHEFLCHNIDTKDPEARSYIDEMNKLGRRQKASLTNMINFRVTLEFPGDDLKFQRALKRLKPADAIFYNVCTDQRYKIGTMGVARNKLVMKQEAEGSYTDILHSTTPKMTYHRDDKNPSVIKVTMETALQAKDKDKTPVANLKASAVFSASITESKTIKLDVTKEYEIELLNSDSSRLFINNNMYIQTQESN
jgi:hypothetical protein